METNASEKEVYERLKKTFDDVLHIGIPDFLCLKDGKLTFVEAKYGYSRLSEDQKKAHEILKKHGFDVRVERTPIRKHPRLYEAWLINNPADRVLSTPCQDNPDQFIPPYSDSHHANPSHATPAHATLNQTIPFQIMPCPSSPHHSFLHQLSPSPQPKGGKEK